MVTKQLASKWTPAGFIQRVRRIVKRPADVRFALEIGYFMWRAPTLLHRQNLRAFLAELRTLPRPAAADAKTSLERVLRLRRLWLALPLMRSRDNCYVRAMTLYRFLDAGAHAVSIHFGIEERDDPGERLRGHAWVSVDGQFLEGPPQVLNARIREMPLVLADVPDG
jgi:hypothetical protein